MRVLLASLLVSCVVAFDAVIFSNEQKITNEFPSIENLLSTATTDLPVIFFVNPDFTLGQFSQHVNAYSDDKTVSGLPSYVKQAKYNAARFLDNGIHTPSAVEVTSANEFKTGSNVYIISGENWATLDSLVQQLSTNLGTKFTGVITATEAVSKDHTRVKRLTVNTNTLRGEAAEDARSFPMVMPLYPGAYKAKYGGCLLYSEGISIVVYSKEDHGGAYATADLRTNNSKWIWDADSSVDCVTGSVGNYNFNIKIRTTNVVPGYKGSSKDPVFNIPTDTIISFNLAITGDRLGYWQLSNATTTGSWTIPNPQTSFLTKEVSIDSNVPAKSVNYIGMNSVQGWAWGCYSSQALFFPAKDGSGNLIGISLYNTEIQLMNSVKNGTTEGTAIANATFTLNMDDCTGTFSPGSWMGIISAIVLFIGLLFGYIMLQAVKTMDRFDDPKQKQIVINVRE